MTGIWLEIFVVSLMCNIRHIHSKDLPEFVHVCKKSDPNFSQCIIESVELIRPHLVTGEAAYNIPSIEPLVMENLISENVAGMQVVTTNVSAYGCSDFSMKSMAVDLDNHIYTFDVYIPNLRIETDYSVDGKILLVPVKGSGNLEANVTDCVSKCILKGEVYDKDGQKYIKYTSIDLNVTVGGGTVRMENLFNGDKVLLGMLNDVINKNLDPFMKELMPVIEKGLAKIFLQVGNNIVDGYTSDQLFPE